MISAFPSRAASHHYSFVAVSDEMRALITLERCVARARDVLVRLEIIQKAPQKNFKKVYSRSGVDGLSMYKLPRSTLRFLTIGGRRPPLNGVLPSEVGGALCTRYLEVVGNETGAFGNEVCLRLSMFLGLSRRSSNDKLTEKGWRMKVKVTN